MTVELLQSFRLLHARLSACQIRSLRVAESIEEAFVRVHEAASRVQLCESSKLYLEKAVDLVYQNSIGHLEIAINEALRYVFDDRQFRVIILLEDVRGSKSVSFQLEDSTSGEPLIVDLKEGTGAGVRTVVSIIVHVNYLLSKGLEPILFIDEGYAFLAEEYVENFFEFLHVLCDGRGFKLVLISHDTRFQHVCTSEYRIERGIATKVK